MDSLEEVYYNPKHNASFSSVRKLCKATNKPQSQVKNWLRSQNAYTLHKQIKRKFQRNKYHVTNIAELYQADLIDMVKFKKCNDGIKYLLTVIDVFSKYACVKKLKTKTASEVVNAFEDIFSCSERIPNNLQSDRGKEFIAAKVQKLFKRHGVNYYTTNNPDVKAAVIERFNRTLKTKMFKYFTHKNTHRYVDMLQNFVDGYNATVHRTIKMAPKDVNDDNILTVYYNAYHDKRNIKPPKQIYKVGNYVRISKYKHVFEKGYENNWSEEIFKITNVIKRIPIVYKISDLLDEPIVGTFYHQELHTASKLFARRHFSY